MATTFIYSVSQDIPGGVFNANLSSRLYQLITSGITTQLAEISSAGDTLTVRFITDIRTSEKTLLDGDTNPAGGYIARSADYVELSHNALILNQYDRVITIADGITSVTLVSQIKDGYGNSVIGKAEQQNYETAGLAPMNKSKDNVDGSGRSTFVVGPSFDRGVVEITVRTVNFPDRFCEVEFE